MINMSAILIANGTGAVLMIILLLSQKRTVRYGFLDKKLYMTMVFMSISQCVVETATFLIDGKMFWGSRVLNFALNSVVFITAICFSVVWTVYADFKLFENRERLKKRYLPVALPAIISIGCVVVNFFTPVVFTISADNVYTRATFYLLPFAIPFLYLVYGTVMVYRHRHQVQKYLFLPAIIFMLPILLGCILQFIFYGIALIWLGVAIGVMSLYVNVQNEASYIDELSGVFSRQYMSAYVLRMIHERDKSRKLAGIMIDIDRFKSINDRFGHQAGDRAIADFGKILRAMVPQHGMASRYAGDEFVVVLQVEREEDVQALLARMRQETARVNETATTYKLAFSAGYTLYQDGETADAFFEQMDAAMYEEKRRKNEENRLPERRGAR